MCNDHKNNNSLFIMGLIIGALIASAVVLVSAKDKEKIIKKIKSKFQDLLNNKAKPEIKKISKIRRDVLQNVSTTAKKPIKKIAVTIPKNIESLNLTPVKKPKSKKVFKR